ncbi:MAG: S46 family peptidase [Gloeobacteraceae cyanobacterium ES-bin-144]|nr:S46 family peptidase [Verrucomicrobiales bacterium]
MWLFNQAPLQVLKDRYQFEPSEGWLENLQKSSVRFNSGGSGSFVSEDGLLITNHHVGADALHKLSTKEKNLLSDGFYAKSLKDEVPCFDLELNVLQSIEDVTVRVNAAIPKNADAATAFAARRSIIAEIENTSFEKTGLRSDVVTLWQGGAYHLYCYKKYTDVRLVFAPETQIAFFGGDPDNFEFPRYNLDICFFRAYENGIPAKIQNHLKFSTTGAKENELVFVSGHPGRTRRLLTVSALQAERDHALPFSLNHLKSTEVLLEAWSARSEENSRRAKNELFGVKNSRKALDGRIAGLLDPSLMDAKVKTESEFKARLTDHAEFSSALAAYDKIATATKILAAQAERQKFLEEGQSFKSESFEIARALLRAGDERQKPNGDRLREFVDSSKESLEFDLFSGKPIYYDLEILTLTDSLTAMAGKFGSDDPLVQKVFAGKSPHDRAAELIRSTKVGDVAFRKKLSEGGAPTVTAANDPMIELARLVDPEARALRKVFEEQTEVIQQAQSEIAGARNALFGTAGYPDATFTLRLSFGVVKGYEQDGNSIPAMTTIDGVYQRMSEMKGNPPFDLPPLWIRQKEKLNLSTPFNFVSTCDIIGGNSGSPVVNRTGEFVGIIFDGNLQGLSADYAYSDKQGRAICVHSAAMLEALTKVYETQALNAELVSGKMDK